MAGKSNIEWCTDTWNPVVGCSIVSPGCTNCYAMSMARRIEAMQPSSHYAGTTKVVNGNAVWTGKMALAPEHILTVPLRWKRPRRIFVNSMGDLFHEAVPDEWIDRVFAMMALCPQHTFQVLTKRSARMRAYFAARTSGDPWAEAADHIADLIGLEEHPAVLEPHDLPLANVWLGVSCEDQARAEERVPDLLATPAAIRFVSAEPLLGPIDLTYLRQADGTWIDALRGHINATVEQRAIRPRRWCADSWLDWIITGGESGPHARPMHPDWARGLRDQCAAAGVPFFFKQWGAFGDTHPDWPRANGLAMANDGTLYDPADIAYPNGRRYGEAIRAHHDRAHLTMVYRAGKSRAGRLLDGVEHNTMPRVYDALPMAA